jgi:hypothetical protein
MKNKYMRRSHLSERKFRELLRLFAADLNVVQMAEISGVSRQTVSALLARVRERQVRLAEEESPFTVGEIEIEIEIGGSYFGAKRCAERGTGAPTARRMSSASRRVARTASVCLRHSCLPHRL